MIKKVQIILGDDGFTRFFTEENESEMLDYCNRFLTENDVADGQTMMSFEDYIAVNAHLAEKFDDPYNLNHYMDYVEDAWEDVIIYIAERFGEHNWTEGTLVSLLSDLGVFFKLK
jgi:hypothetical protein